MSAAELLALRAALDAVEASLATDDMRALESGVASVREGLSKLPPPDGLSSEAVLMVRDLHQRSEALALRLQERVRSLDLVIASWKEAEESKDEHRR